MLIADTDDSAETGRRLGHDLQRYRCRVNLGCLPPSVGEGQAHAQALQIKALPADRFVRKWLQLRASALQRQRPFDAQITPQLLQAIDVAECPVLRIQLTHAALVDSDWSVDRLNNDGAYAKNNIAVMSVRANRAKGTMRFKDVLARAQWTTASGGLEPAQWLRLAVLMLGPCFAEHPADAPALPLVAPIPHYAVCLCMQQVQHVFTMRSATQAGKNVLIKQFKTIAPTQQAEMRLRLLAEAVHARIKRLPHAHDVWLEPAVMEALRRWRESLDGPAWAAAGTVSSQLAGSSVVPRTRLGDWALATRGYA